MEKRKLKINILDVAIFVVVVCAVLVLVFRDNISDTFGKTEIVSLELELTAESVSPNAGNLFKTGSAIVLEPSNGSGEKLQAVVLSSEFSESGKAEIILSCNGYKKFSSYYTENGTELVISSDCAVAISDIRFVCKLQKVDIKASDR